MSLSRKDYYKTEVLRVVLYPLVFFLVVAIFLQVKAYGGEPVDPVVYWNVALFTLVASLICYGVGYLLVKPKKRRKRKRS